MPDLAPIRQLISDVGIDTALKLLVFFQQDAEQRLSFMETYLRDGGELADVRRHAHSLKGLCRTYGAMDAGEAAEQLQTVCDQEDLEQVGPSIRAVLAKVPAGVEEVLAAAQHIKDETA